MEESLNTKKNFERINYSLRPAKHVERKMFCETFGRLSILDNIKNYRYIGMGSAYFSDFNLFHKVLGITKLVSIEWEEESIYKKRINFNKPFACIDVEFGSSSNVLPRLPWFKWKEKSIVWLDYIDKIKEYMFGDIDTVVFNIQPGSVFLISVNIEEDNERDESANIKKLSAKEFRLEQLKENVGKDHIPQTAFEMILNVDKNKVIIREIIHNAILSALRKRNSGLNDLSTIQYKQLINIYYKDSADMLSVGGIFYTEGQKQQVNTMFKNLDFMRPGVNCFNIIVPKLTYREIHALEKTLPNQKTLKTGIAKNKFEKIPLSKFDVKNYANIYRYFPTFAEMTL